MSRGWTWLATGVMLVGCAASEPRTNAEHVAFVPTIDRDCVADSRAGRIHAPPAQPEYFTPPAPPQLEIARLGKRLAGDGDVLPDWATEDAMYTSGLRSTSAIFKICFGTDGTPKTIKVTHSSCFPRWEAQIVDAIKKWRYSLPHSEDGVPMAVCTAATFNFKPYR